MWVMSLLDIWSSSFTDQGRRKQLGELKSHVPPKVATAMEIALSAAQPKIL